MLAMLIVSTFLVRVEVTETSAEEPKVLQMQAQARRLARDMQEWESRLSMTPYIVDIRDFADFVEARATAGFDDETLTDCRIEWERVRAQVFGPKDWFLSW
jgi:hypothetical protein